MSCLKTFQYLVVILFLLLSSSLNILAQTSVFNYQGRLQDTGTPANGTYDFQFRLFDALIGGNQVGTTLIRDDVGVTSGIFSVSLDFGAAAFPGGDRFLEISVRPGVSTGPFTILSPLELISSTPYALHSSSASSADAAATATNATQLGGVAASQYTLTTDPRLSNARAPLPGSNNYIQNSTTQQTGSNFNISGNGIVGGTVTGSTVNALTQFTMGGIVVLKAVPFNNTFVGFDAGSFNTGSENSFVGRFAGHFNTTGSANSFFGSGAGFANTEGSSNTFVGNHAGQTNTTGAINSFFGSGSGFFNTIGSYNSFFGSEAGALNTEGHDNAFFGRTAGYNNVLGSNNSFFGNLAGYNNTGDQNSFFGTFAGFAGTSGHDNASFGYQAGYNNQTGSFNAFFGSGAGLSSQGCCNSFFGESAGTSNATGFNNTAIGAGANFGAPNLTNATAVGASALVNQNNSLVLGSIANINGATSDTNVGIGTTAPQARLDVRGNSVFSGNVGIGTLGPSVKLDVAGNIAMNNSLIQLRGGSDLNHGVVYSGAVDGPEFRGFGGFRWTNGAGGVSERMRLDLNGNLGIGTASPQARLHVNGVIRLDVLGTPLGNSPLCLNASNQIAFCNISSLRYKTNVHSFLDGLSIINKLRPISFDWKDGGLHDVGLAAEEVDRVAPLFAFRNNKGEIEGVKYNQLSAVFINAFKEQQAQILKQQEQLKRQEEKIAREQDQARQERAMLNAQQLQIDALKKLVCRTHRRNAMCK